LVSGDKHLLKLICYHKTKVLSVNEFLQVLEAKG
jgi:predicted nucleic acid-binding protein